jgi:hypothetical protein
MKVGKFLAVLRPYATVIAAHGGERLSAQIENLSEAWKPAMSWSMRDLIARAWPKEPIAEADETNVREFREALGRLKDVVETVAKQDFIADLSALIEALEPHDREDLASFVNACQLALKAAQPTNRKSTKKAATTSIGDQRIDEIVRQLKETYKDADRFAVIYKQLSDDQAVTKADMAAIASQVAYETPPSIPRAESLRRIWTFHEAYATSAAKTKSSAGRSAA